MEMDLTRKHVARPIAFRGLASPALQTEQIDENNPLTRYRGRNAPVFEQFAAWGVLSATRTKLRLIPQPPATSQLAHAALGVADNAIQTVTFR